MTSLEPVSDTVGLHSLLKFVLTLRLLEAWVNGLHCVDGRQCVVEVKLGCLVRVLEKQVRKTSE